MAVVILAGTHAVTVSWLVWLSAFVATAGVGALTQWMVTERTRRQRVMQLATVLGALIVIVWGAECPYWTWICYSIL